MKKSVYVMNFKQLENIDASGKKVKTSAVSTPAKQKEVT